MSPRATSVGTDRSVVSPTPRRPPPLFPQHQSAKTSASIAQAWAPPELTRSKRRSGATGVGDSRIVWSPTPSWALPLTPQHRSAPAVVSIAHVDEPPTLTELQAPV